ncbi:hypothetical protein [Vibrio sp. ES.051]|uniref:hypothetical protein n=1 Tax=Vibrio sp. ES.051 TaxID=1761909 RepID=UPI0015CEF5D3|nr:hypothetical protein [Vibrio sp. ES.051]
MKLDMDSGHTAEQVDSQENGQTNSSVTEKLKMAYIKAREQLELTEVELNRSKIMMVDQDGNLTKVPILSEH